MEKCFYCDQDALYHDIVVDKENYIIADVCKKHFSVSYVS